MEPALFASLINTLKVLSVTVGEEIVIPLLMGPVATAVCAVFITYVSERLPELLPVPVTKRSTALRRQPGRSSPRRFALHRSTE